MERVAWARWAFRLGFLALCLCVLYVGVTFVQVWRTSGDDQTRPVDVIVVLGAAQYDGRPSPVLEARLDKALELYEDGIAPVVIVTGGKQEGDRFTEAFSGYDYLRDHGIPEDALFLEVDGRNTYEQLSASKLIMDQQGSESALLVSSPYHSERLLGIAAEVGIPAAHVAPADTGSSLPSLIRETAAVAAGRLVGYRRLGNWM